MAETNEELAILSAAGDAAATERLYKQVERLLSSVCMRYYRGYTGICMAGGVNYDDLMQAAYFALLDAVRAYEPERGYRFTTYLRYPVRNRLNECAGVRLRSGVDDAIRKAASLDEPMPGTDETLTLGETIGETDDGYEKTDLRMVLDDCLTMLTEEERIVLEKRFYEDKSRAEVANELGADKSLIARLELQALNRLKHSGRVMSSLRAFVPERAYEKPSTYGGGMRSFTISGSSVERAALWEYAKMERMRRTNQCNQRNQPLNIEPRLTLTKG